MRGTVVLLPNDYFRVFLEPGDHGMKHYQWINYPYQSSSSMSQYQYHKAKQNDQHQQSHLEGCRHSMTFLHCNPAFRHDDLGAQHQHGSTGGSLIPQISKSFSPSAYSKIIQFYTQNAKLCKRCKCRDLATTCKKRGFT